MTKLELSALSWLNLLSHKNAVPSVLMGLTTLFGMGRGVAPLINSHLFPNYSLSLFQTQSKVS